FGTKEIITIETPNNTLLAASTPAIDSTILEDQILGTRFLTFRSESVKPLQVMQKIDSNAQTQSAMRKALKAQVDIYELSVEPFEYEVTDRENKNLQLLTKQCASARTSVELDKSKEVRNIPYTEGPGRLYHQLKRLYRAYRVIGLVEDEAIKLIRKICVDSVPPVRMKMMKWLAQQKDLVHTTSDVAKGVRMGKGHTKGHLSALYALRIVDYEEVFDETYRRFIDQWTYTGADFNLLMGMSKQVELGGDSI
ncbi:hypothetical protein ACFLRF_04850, partial [Candidatus Altiarchaeota archaeon]